MKKIVGILLLVMIVIYFPKSFGEITDYENAEYMTIILVKPEINEQGEPLNFVYEMNVQHSSDSFDQIINILDNVRYQPKLRNLLPYEFEVTNQNFNYTMTLTFYDQKKYQTVFFLGDERICVENDMYHMLPNGMDDIAKYIIENGELSQ